MFGGVHYHAILIALGGQLLGRNFDRESLERCKMWNLYINSSFGPEPKKVKLKVICVIYKDSARVQW
jgi:hypothetical protein